MSARKPSGNITDPAGARTIAVFTTGRHDWGILRSTCVAIRADPRLHLRLVVGGMHLASHYGATVRLVREDGFEPDVELRWIDDREEAPTDVQASAALAEIGRHLRVDPPDAIVLAGDRFETMSAAVAATLARVAIVHLHGGEQTEGAFDDAFRHAITKLAHLHLVSSEEHARRVQALGENASTVHVVGPPSLDALARPDLADRAELERVLGLDLRSRVVIVTVHPVTLDLDPAAIVYPVVDALDRVEATYVITLPNADPRSEEVRVRLMAAASQPDRVAVEALGERRYWGLMRIADAMLGNSSSGLIEAPAVDLPAVNVGDRQAGRHRETNVIDVPADASAIADALRRVLDPETHDALRTSHPKSLDGRVGERVASIIGSWQPSNPPRKLPIT